VGVCAHGWVPPCICLQISVKTIHMGYGRMRVRKVRRQLLAFGLGLGVKI